MEDLMISLLMITMLVAFGFLVGFDLRTFIAEEKEKRMREELKDRTEREIQKNLETTMETFCNFRIE
jgi:hypothetical protein